MDASVTPHRSTNLQSDEPGGKELYKLEASDPEGHGPNIRLTPARVFVGALGIGLLASLSAGLAWAIFGTDIAMIVLGTFLISLLLGTVPIGGVMLLRSKEHSRLERRARIMHAWTSRRSARRTTESAGVAKAMPTDLDSQQRLDDDGSPTAGANRPQ